MMRLGVLINPWAGIGGPAGLKGSDGAGIVREALARGIAPRAHERMRVALAVLQSYADRLHCVTWGGAMGAAVLTDLGFACEVLGAPDGPETTAEDTLRAAQALASRCDLLLFAGGDGTARNLVDAIGTSVPVIGVPAGVKIHSGVYAVTPSAAGEIIVEMLQGRHVAVIDGEVRDIDEVACREGRVIARTYGVLRVPGMPRHLQHVKCGGQPVEALVLADIAAGVIDRLEDERYYIVGPGTTTRALLEALGETGSLLGVDVLQGRRLVGRDLSEPQLWSLLAGQPCSIIVTVIGGQGHIFGRGNQQISARIVSHAGKDNLWVVATPSKLDALDGRPLRVDTGDEALDQSLSGWMRVTTGYDDHVLVRCESGAGD